MGKTTMGRGKGKYLFLNAKTILLSSKKKKNQLINDPFFFYSSKTESDLEQ
jgi:hypothetical protein